MKDPLADLKRTKVLGKLSIAEFDELKKSTKLMRLSRKASLRNRSQDQDNVYVLIHGGLKSCKLQGNGKKLIYHLFKPGDMFGEDVLLNPGSDSVSYTAINDSTIAKIKGKTLRKLIENNPRAQYELLKLFGARTIELRERMSDMVSEEIRTRTARLLLKLARDFGKRVKNGTAINLRITHEDISNYIGASRETVSLSLGYLRRRGIIKMDVRRIIVADMKKLASV